MKSYFAALQRDCDYDEVIKALERQGAVIDLRLPRTRCVGFSCAEGDAEAIRSMPSVQSLNEGRAMT